MKFKDEDKFEFNMINFEKSIKYICLSLVTITALISTKDVGCLFFMMLISMII